MSPLERLGRADNGLKAIALLVMFAGMLAANARRRVLSAAREVGPLVAERDQVLAERDRLRTQLDGALERLHEVAGGDQGSAKDHQGPDQGGSLDSPGSIQAGEG